MADRKVSINNILQIISTKSPVDAWSIISKKILSPNHPFSLHTSLFDTVYGNWNDKDGPKPVWIPDKEEISKTNIGGFQAELGIDTFAELHKWSASHRMEFWEKVTKKLSIVFQTPYQKIAVTDHPETPQWYYGAKMNIAQSCFKAEGEKTALIYQEEGGEIKRWTYNKLHEMSRQVALGLVKIGLKKGDAIAIDMIMTAESVAIYLGIVKAGCVVVSIPDSLAPAEVQKRLEIARVKLIFTQDVLIRGGKQLPLYEKVLQAGPLKAVVLPARGALCVKLRIQDMSWKEFIVDTGMLRLCSAQDFEWVYCNPADPINILFSSGTTGAPKAIPWNHTTPVKCASDGFFHHDIHEGDVVAWPTNLGWMMGPWLIFASFINKASIALYYGTPTGREFGEFVQNANVNMLGVVPSIVKQWKASNCLDGLDWSALKCYSSTGESSNANDMFWLMTRAGYKPVIEYCGGTEIGGGYLSGTLVQPASPSYFTTPALGLDIIILDEDEKYTNRGEVFIIPPSIGLSTWLLNQDHHEVYYSGTPELIRGNDHREILRRHGDEIEAAPSGFFRAHGRVDDTMNLGGIKVSSIEIERVLNQAEGVVETAAVAVNESGGGPDALVIYAVLNNGPAADTGEWAKNFQQLIKSRLNPLFKIKEVVGIAELPRTASNKIMRRVLRKHYSLR